MLELIKLIQCPLALSAGKTNKENSFPRWSTNEVSSSLEKRGEIGPSLCLARICSKNAKKKKTSL